MVKTIQYSEFFKCRYERGEIPVITSTNKKDPEIIALVEEELSRCLGGVFVNDVFISGWLYWHLNHWWIADDVEDEFGNILRKKLRPSLRDNEWIVAGYIEECRVQKKGYLHVGVRQFGKSEIMASYLAYNATLFKLTQNVVVGGNDNDLGLLKDKIDFGISSLWNGIKIPKLTKDSKANTIKLGLKTTSNDNEIWSLLVIRNVSEGKKTEGPAGVTAKAFAIDEIGKFPFAQTYEASKPAFVSKFGWRCVPLLFGTGGSFEKGADAERYFYHPEANNFLSVVNEESGEKTAIFMSGLYRIDCKYRTTLGEYLVAEGKLSGDIDRSELLNITIDVSDKKLALERIKADRELKALDPDQTEYLKLIMYYPLTPKECFMSSADNFYNKEIAEDQKRKLEKEFPGFKIGMNVELEEFQDNKIVSTNISLEDIKIRHIISSKVPVSSFPCKPNENLNVPIVILEHPILNPPYGLYTAGIDPYRFEKAPNSDSLGAVYIFKRAYDVLSDTFQDMPVAWYVGRPDSKESWNNNARLLIEYYNAIALCENDEMSFIDYMISKDKGHFLMDTPDWVRQMIPNSSTLGRNKGVSSAAPKVKELLRTNLKQYMEEIFTTIPINGTTETKKVLGVTKIYDPMLLEEIIKWNKDGNFDREIAVSLAITCARKLDAQHLKVSVQSDDPRFLVPVNYQKHQVRRPTFKPLSFSPTKTRLNKLFK